MGSGLGSGLRLGLGPVSQHHAHIACMRCLAAVSACPLRHLGTGDHCDHRPGRRGQLGPGLARAVQLYHPTYAGQLHARGADGGRVVGGGCRHALRRETILGRALLCTSQRVAGHVGIAPPPAGLWGAPAWVSSIAHDCPPDSCGLWRGRAGPVVRATSWSSKLSTPRSHRHRFCIVTARFSIQAGRWRATRELGEICVPACI